MVAISLVGWLSTWDRNNVTAELNFLVYLILVHLNLNIHMWVEATILDSSSLEVGWINIRSLPLYLFLFFPLFLPAFHVSLLQVFPSIHDKVTPAKWGFFQGNIFCFLLESFWERKKRVNWEKNESIRLCRILRRKSFEVKEVCDHPMPLKPHLTGTYPSSSLERKSQLSISYISGIDISRYAVVMSYPLWINWCIS